MWACCGPGQLPHMGQFCACSLPCMCLLIAISVPVDCHTGASCLPHRCLVSATCGPHVGQTTATCGPHVGQRCKTRVAHMCALGGNNFNCHMWALCGPLVECLLGDRPTFVCKRKRSTSGAAQCQAVMWLTFADLHIERIQCVFSMTLFLSGSGISISWTLRGRVPEPPGKCRQYIM